MKVFREIAQAMTTNALTVPQFKAMFDQAAAGVRADMRLVEVDDIPAAHWAVMLHTLQGILEGGVTMQEHSNLDIVAAIGIYSLMLGAVRTLEEGREVVLNEFLAGFGDDTDS